MLRGTAPDAPRYADIPPVPMPDNPRMGTGGSIYENQTEMKRRPLAETVE